MIVMIRGLGDSFPQTLPQIIIIIIKYHEPSALCDLCVLLRLNLQGLSENPSISPPLRRSGMATLAVRVVPSALRTTIA